MNYGAAAGETFISGAYRVNNSHLIRLIKKVREKASL